MTLKHVYDVDTSHKTHFVLYIIIIIIYRSMDGGIEEEDEYASDPITQQTRQVSKGVSDSKTVSIL